MPGPAKRSRLKCGRFWRFWVDRNVLLRPAKRSRLKCGRFLARWGDAERFAEASKTIEAEMRPPFGALGDAERFAEVSKTIEAEIRQSLCAFGAMRNVLPGPAKRSRLKCGRHWARWGDAERFAEVSKTFKAQIKPLAEIVDKHGDPLFDKRAADKRLHHVPRAAGKPAADTRHMHTRL